MKNAVLLAVGLLLLSGVSFAGDAPDSKVPKESTQPSSKSGYKSSPRLSYGSNKPDKDDSGLSNLKPMLDQTLGNNKDGVGGGLMPNGGTYKF